MELHVDYVKILTVSDEAKPLTFTLADHDLLLKCVGGIDQLLQRFAAVEQRQTLAETRLKVMEDWKIKVMAIVLVIGMIFGYILSKVIPPFIPMVLPVATTSTTTSTSTPVPPASSIH